MLAHAFLNTMSKRTRIIGAVLFLSGLLVVALCGVLAAIGPDAYARYCRPYFSDPAFSSSTYQNTDSSKVYCDIEANGDTAQITLCVGNSVRRVWMEFEIELTVTERRILRSDQVSKYQFAIRATWDGKTLKLEDESPPSVSLSNILNLGFVDWEFTTTQLAEGGLRVNLQIGYKSDKNSRNWLSKEIIVECRRSDLGKEKVSGTNGT